MASYPVIGWTQADRLAIEVDPATHAWNAGHVNDILSVAPSAVLAASDSGGVWRFLPGPDPGFQIATPLSDDWANPDVNCLALGPDAHQHVFAGCTSIPDTTAGLYETNPTAAEPLRAWALIPVDRNTGTIYRIGISANARLIVLACDGGVFWSAIPGWPASGTQPRQPYAWQQAVWPAGAGPVACSGLAVGPGEAPIVSTLAGGNIFYGAWTTSASGTLGLTLKAATFTTPLAGPGISIGRTSLASAPSNAAQVYCVASNATLQPDGKTWDYSLYAVASSTNGGQTWSPLTPTVGTQTLNQVAGGQGWYNNCIAVSPAKQSTVAIGWSEGTFVSDDSGSNWTLLDGGGHLHADVHGLHFDPEDSAGQTLYIASDGGCAMTPDLGATFSSAYNRSLLNLQFTSPTERGLWGTLGASTTAPGVVAAGLQDNATVYSLLGSTPWRVVPGAGGDGSLGMFIPPGQLLSCYVGWGGDPVPVRISSWDGGSLSMSTPATVPIFSPQGSDPAGLMDPSLELVDSPSFAHGGRRMFAAGGYGAVSNVLYGLFAAADGSDARWEKLSTLSPNTFLIYSAASQDGSEVYVGGRIPAPTSGANDQAVVFRVNSKTGRTTRLRNPPTLVAGQPDTGVNITRILILADGTVIAVYNASGGGCLLRWEGPRGWAQIRPDRRHPNARIYSLAVDEQQTLYATTDHGVFLSHPGTGWQNASAGLPRRTHCADLRFVKNHEGGIALYLSTYGRSLWKATWTAAPEAARPGRAPAFAWNDLIGSLADGKLYKFTGQGLVPTGPIDPELEKQLRTAYTALIAASDRLSRLAADTEAAAIQSPQELQALARLDQALTALSLGTATLRTLAGTAKPEGEAGSLRNQLAEASDLVVRSVTAIDRTGATLADRGGIKRGVETVTAELQQLTKLAAQMR